MAQFDFSVMSSIIIIASFFSFHCFASCLKISWFWSSILTSLYFLLLFYSLIYIGIVYTSISDPPSVYFQWKLLLPLFHASSASHDLTYRSEKKFLLLLICITAEHKLTFSQNLHMFSCCWSCCLYCHFSIFSLSPSPLYGYMSSSCIVIHM